MTWGRRLRWPAFRLVSAGPDVAAALHHEVLRVFAGDERPRYRGAHDGVDHVADLDLRDVDPQHLAVRVVDVHLHLAVVDALLGVRGHVDRLDPAVRLD